ncbi:nuclease-related domain-containing protein [Cryobacterium sp. MLB-32]|uniref:nuclease-related domain-containing protein n=1 Tax=Cryobacterium sp. MLB-32 TaxID=1529318 RepID=UPI0018CFE135|nr:nuclease-related domain-containing protein [Cryobacterium sp. MLB-32]
MTHAPSIRRRHPAASPPEQRLRTVPVPSQSAPARGYLTTQGELALATLLQEPPLDWAVFPAGPSGPVSEHLMVGPGGVFTINTRHSDGEWIWVDKDTIRVSGRRMAYRQDAVVEAQRVTALLRARIPLRAPVRPVIALVGARFIVVRGKTPAMAVVDARELQVWLEARPTVLRPIERMELAAVIDNPVTWGARPSMKRPDAPTAA